MQYPLGAPRGPPIQGPGLQGCPGSLQGSQGQKQPETTLLWDQCSGRHPPTPPKTHRPLTPHQLLQTCSTPVVAPIQKGLPQTPFPMLHPLPWEALSDPLPGCQAKPRWGAGKGRGKGKERGKKGASPCSGPLLTGLQSNSPTTEPHI